MYNLRMVEVLEEISAAYERVGIKILYLGEPIPGWADIPPEALADATFMDDIALAVDGEDPDATLGRVRWAVAAVIDALSRRGIRVNLKRHKTAVLVSLRGQGARLTLANLVGNSDGWMEIETGALGNIRVALTEQYKHLGGMLDAQCAMRPEVQYRTASASGAYAPVRAKFFQNERLPRRARGWVLESDVMSRCTYNAGTWDPMTKGEFKLYSGQYMRMTRGLLPPTIRSKEAELSNRTACALLGRPEPVDALRVQQLRHLGHICKAQDSQLTSLLAWEHKVAPPGASWLSRALRAERRWETFEPPPHSRETVADVNALVSRAMRDPPRWLARVRTIKRRMLTWASALAPVWALRDALGQAPEEDHAGQPPSDSAAELSCPECHKPFASVKKLQAHRTVVHSFRKDERRWAHGSWCAGCALEWHTRERLIGHLRRTKGRGCLEAIKAFFPPFIRRRHDQARRQRRHDRARHHQDQRLQGELQEVALAHPHALGTHPHRQRAQR